MNKLITKVAKLVLGLSLAAGVGVAIGSKAAERADATTYTDLHTLDTTGSLQTNNQTYGSVGTATTDGIEWSFTGNGKMNPWRLGGKTAQSGDQPFYTNTAISGGVDRIVVEFGALSGLTANSFQMSVHSSAADAASGSNAITNETHTGLSIGNNVTATIDLNSTQTGKFYRFVPNLTISSTSNKYLQLKTVTFKHAQVSSKTLSSIAITGSMTKTSYRTNESWDPTGFVVTATYDDSSTENVSGDVSWTYSPASPSSTSTVSVTATASYTEGGVTKTATSSAQTVSVTDKGTASNPYTVSEAWTIANGLASGSNNGSVVYVTGVVSGSVSISNGRGTFDITDGTKTIKAYSIDGVTNSDPSLATYVADKYTVVITGAIINFGGTLEVGFATGFSTSLISSEAPVVSTTYNVTFVANGGSNSPAAQEVGEGLTFTFPSAGTNADNIFKGWSSDNATFYQEGELSPEVETDIEYTAYWQTKGTLATPYSVSEARSAIASNAGIKGVNVSGIISQVGNYNNNTITYYISDDGTTTNHLEVYKGKGVENANFTAASDIETGANVVVYGNLKNYGGTYEFDSGNYLKSYEAPAAVTVSSISISGSLTTTSYTTAESWDPSGLTVTATYSNSTSEDVTSSVSWSYSPATPAAMGAGTDTLTITATYEGETDSTTESVTVTTASFTNTSSLVAGNYYLKIANKYFTGSVSSGVGELNSLKPGDAGKFTFTLVGNDEWSVINAEGNRLGITGTSSKNLFCGSNDTYTFKVIDGETSGTYILNSIQNSARYVACYNSADLRTYAANQSGATYEFTLEVAKTVSSFSVDTTNANKNVLKGSTFDATAAAAAGFQARLNYTDSTFDDVTANATWTLNTSVANNNATLTVTYESYTAVEITGMNVYVVTIVSLSIDTTNAKTSGYWTGDSLDTSGLVITGYDSSDNEYSIALGDCQFSPTTLTTAGSSIQITVSYENESGSTASGTYNVAVQEFAYSKGSSLNGGDTVIITNSGETKYLSAISQTSTIYGIASEYTGKPSTSYVFKVVAGSTDGSIAFKNSDNKYLNWSSGNSLNAVDSVSDNSSWTVTFDGTVATIANVADSTRIIKWNNDRFAAYANNNVVNVTLWKLNGSSGQNDAETFATDFYDDVVTGVCAVNDSKFEDDMPVIWELYEDVYEALSNEAKAYIASKAPSASGDSVQKMLYEYKHIYETYGTSLSLSNFIGRTEVVKQSARVIPGGLSTVLNENTNTIAIIVIISLVSVTAIGGYFFIKRREQN